jgi:hypothetical protein
VDFAHLGAGAFGEPGFLGTGGPACFFASSLTGFFARGSPQLLARLFAGGALGFRFLPSAFGLAGLRAGGAPFLFQGLRAGAGHPAFVLACTRGGTGRFAQPRPV